MNAYAAVDIGASSGRIMLGRIKDGRLQLEEVHRFSNGFAHSDGHDRWQIDRLISEILIGLEKVKMAGITHLRLGIDTWAVDYVLVNAAGRKIHDPISYRDKRTANSIEELCVTLPKEYIYEKTGIQFQEFNTLYQLYREDYQDLQQAAMILMIPDYIGYVLTGTAVTEVTNASTTQMMNLRQGLFDKDLMAQVRVSATQFPHLVEAGTSLGKIRRQWYDDYDIPETEVITVATHDTASAVVGTPGAGNDWAYLSSGTWSLLGVELNTPENGLAAYHGNYTNEWGAYGTYRFLKNIMGMWIIQCIKRDYQDRYQFAELAAAAALVDPFQVLIDVNDARFANPPNMISAIQEYARSTGQPIPRTPAQLVRAVYDSLALYYAEAIDELAAIIERPIRTLNVVGGGANIGLLNQLTADLAGVAVIAGPGEASAIGNILVQMIADGAVSDIVSGRQLVANSFALHTYQPEKNRYPGVRQRYTDFMAVQRQGVHA